MTEQFANFAITTLASAISATEDIISVLDPSKFPLIGNFRIVVQYFGDTKHSPVIGPELMLVTAVNGAQFTVIRGYENTIQTAFPARAQVANIITAGIMQELFTGGGGGGGGNYREVDATVVNMTSSDGTVEISQTIPARSTVYVNTAGMTVNQRQTVLDGAGVASNYPITIVPLNGVTISGNSNATIFDNWGAITWLWNGENLRVIA